MIDVDFFKKFNDIYGHQAGDMTLQKIAMVLKNSINRPNDYVFRLGGEEFGILYSAKTQEDGFCFMEKIRQNIENLKIKHSDNSASEFVTISTGVYFIKPKDITSVENIYKECDEKLYRAKEGGRNRVVV